MLPGLDAIPLRREFLRLFRRSLSNGGAAAARSSLGASASGDTVFTGTPAQGRTALGLVIGTDVLAPNGNGASLTALNATQLTSGDVPAARLATALNASGSAPFYVARAWVNFNGSGSIAIRASGNVTSLTDNGVGDYQTNFTTAISDTSYYASCTSVQNTMCGPQAAADMGTGSCRVRTVNADGTAVDRDFVGVAIFR